jgi:hypothetical protein
MQMEFTRCSNPDCGRPYQINKFGPSHSSFADFGKLICPHCGLLVSSNAKLAFLTHAMSDAEEAAFNVINPRVAAGERA